MSGFKLIEGEYAIVSTGGVFKQVPLAERDGLIYAATGGGFIQLRADGSSSKSSVRLDELSWEGPLHKTKLGKLCRPGVADSKPLPNEAAQLLLASD